MPWPPVTPSPSLTRIPTLSNTAFSPDLAAAPVVVPALHRWMSDGGTLALCDGFTVVWGDSSLAETARNLVAEIAES